MAESRQAERGAADYGREALTQWVDAARYGARALAARRETAKDGPGLKGLKERLDPTQTDKGGKAGDLADLALSKLGSPGRLASKVKLGSRLVDRVGGGIGGKEIEPAEQVEPGEEGAAEENGVAAGDAVGAGAPLPIQGSIDVALPVAAVFDLCTRFEEFPQIVDRVSAVEVEDDSHFSVVVRVGKRQHELSVELLDELPEERLDWECGGELEHSGVLTFHPLAPRLTRLELTIERASESPLSHLTRVIGLPDRVLAQELRRFKAVAELWEDGKRYEPAEIGAPVEAEMSDRGDEAEAEEDEPPEEDSGADEEEGPEG
jgi:uncharacterized membrane protein